MDVNYQAQRKKLSLREVQHSGNNTFKSEGIKDYVIILYKTQQYLYAQWVYFVSTDKLLPLTPSFL